MTAYPPITRYSARAALNSKNRSLKSRLYSMPGVPAARLEHHLPRRGEPRLGASVSPELAIERAPVGVTGDSHHELSRSPGRHARSLRAGLESGQKSALDDGPSTASKGGAASARDR